ncbi:MAG: hypothetical protein HY071_02580 [Chloroflexi bacterium]|nr:hypothetical protein [Chloroflexota bacterium]
MSGSPSCSRRCGRSSAPDLDAIADLALIVLLFSAGARTPLLALLSLRRPRNLVAVVLPYLALLGLALVLSSYADERTRLGILALAASPAELAAPAFAGALGGRMETAGALLAGTLVASLISLFAVGGGGAAFAGYGSIQSAAIAFLVAATIAGAAPMLRDRILPLLHRASDAALLALIVVAIVGALGALTLSSVAAALAVLVVGLGTAWLAAALYRRDVVATLAGAGTRDFAVAIAIAGAASSAVPLVYGGLLAATAAIAIVVRRRRRQPG